MSRVQNTMGRITVFRAGGGKSVAGYGGAKTPRPHTSFFTHIPYIHRLERNQEEEEVTRPPHFGAGGGKSLAGYGGATPASSHMFQIYHTFRNKFAICFTEAEGGLWNYTKKENIHLAYDDGATTLHAAASTGHVVSQTTLETTQGQIHGFSQLPFKCYLPEVASVGD